MGWAVGDQAAFGGNPTAVDELSGPHWYLLCQFSLHFWEDSVNLNRDPFQFGHSSLRKSRLVGPLILKGWLKPHTPHADRPTGPWSIIIQFQSH